MVSGLSLLWITDLSINDGSLTNPQGFSAVFKAGSVGAPNKIVLVLLREECAGVGKDVGILFVLVSEHALCVLIPNSPLPSEWKSSSSFSPLPQLFLNPLVLFAS